MANISYRWLLAATTLMLIAFTAVTPLSANAQAVTPAPVVAGSPTTTTADQNCTDFAGAWASVDRDDGQVGLLSEIYIFIKDVVGTATQKLFSAFTENAAYQNAVYWTMVLMVVFFGIAFTIGIVQVSFQQVLVRLVKIGVIVAVISPGGWYFFSDYVVKFFMDGTDDLVKGVIQIGVGGSNPLPANATPFYQFDQLAKVLIQPDTIVAIMGSTFAGGPYGMAMGGLMMIAVWGFVSLLVKALKVYATTFVARSLLLGVAPIFIVFMLFDRTKQMFMSWLQALLAMSLQPILLFTFLSFFMVLIQSAGRDMMSADLCWTEFTSVQGTASKAQFWRFKDKQTGELITSQLTWEGSIQCLIEGKGKDGKPCSEFPINIIDILSFLILVYIAQRFSDVIDRIANELSNTFISLDAGGKIDQFMTRATQSLGKAPSK